jgi:hypothetical protein
MVGKHCKRHIGTSKVSSNDSGPARARVIAKNQLFQICPRNFLSTAEIQSGFRAYWASAEHSDMSLQQVHDSSSTNNIILRAYYACQVKVVCSKHQSIAWQSNHNLSSASRAQICAPLLEVVLQPTLWYKLYIPFTTRQSCNPDTVPSRKMYHTQSHCTCSRTIFHVRPSDCTRSSSLSSLKHGLIVITVVA